LTEYEVSCWINGNLSELDRVALIVIARYFERRCEEAESITGLQLR